jgi:hypothetical protein
VVEMHILENCNVLTVGQRCDDWFVLRQFRITGTKAGKILMASESVRAWLGLQSSAHVSEPSGPIEEESMLLSFLASSWFN